MNRFIRQFASKEARCINLEEVTIGDITLKELFIANSPVTLYGPSDELYSGLELFSCRDFITNELTFFCHDAAKVPCHFHSTYSCYHFPQLIGKSGRKIGQLLTVLTAEQPNETCFLREFVVKSRSGNVYWSKRMPKLVAS